MRMILFFDLPMQTYLDRKEYTLFRKFLINDGFIMLQFSVYSRTVRNHYDARKHCQIIESKVPASGSVRVLTITEKQYSSMKLLAGEKLSSEKLLDTKDIIEL